MVVASVIYSVINKAEVQLSFKPTDGKTENVEDA